MFAAATTRSALVMTILAMILIPLISSWFAYPSTHLPPGFGIFPPQFVEDPPGFNLIVFVVIALLEAAVAIFLIFPQWFGFKPVTPSPQPVQSALPCWFWAGMVVTLFFWWLMWARTTPFGDLVYYAFTPMWWGFIFVLDGLTFRYAAGISSSILIILPWVTGTTPIQMIFLH